MPEILDGFFLLGVAQDPAYSLNRDNNARADVRAELERIWRRVSHLVGDRNFREKAKDDFESAAWHLFLLDRFLDLGLTLLPAAPQGPDIHVVVDGRTVWVEAISAKQGTGADAAPNPPTGRAYHPSDTEILLRHTAALVEKRAQRDRWVADKTIDNTDIFVIALSAGRVPDAFMPPYEEFSYCEQVLFGVGDVQFSFEVGTGRFLGQSFAPRATLTKRNGAVVPSHMFADPLFRGVSAVLYSADHFAAKQGARLRTKMIHNPNASSPLPLGTFRLGLERSVSAEGTLVTQDWRGAT